MMLYSIIFFFIQFFIMKITPHQERYIKALALAITAPTETLSTECVNMASYFEEFLTSEEIKECRLCIQLAQEESLNEK